MAMVRSQLSIPDDSPLLAGRVDRAVQQLTGWSRAQVSGLFDHDCVSINDVLVQRPERRLAAGDVVQVCYDNDRKYHPIPRPRGLGFDIVFEDAAVIIVHKPPELLSVPTRRNEEDTLLDRVRDYVRQRGGRGAFQAHRLDRGVSGLLVFGKTFDIAAQIRDQFAEHKPLRRYIAIVAGHLAHAAGTFDSLLATDASLNRFSTRNAEIGQRAVTHYRCLERLQFPGGQAPVSLVEARLETGRRHQIRVHFADAGHPVLGDRRYRPDRSLHELWPYDRMALHALTLGLTHPVHHRTLKFTSRLPGELRHLLGLADSQQLATIEAEYRAAPVPRAKR